MRMVLLPSPLLGAASWRPVADELVRRGRPVTVASYGRPVAGPPDVLDELLAGVPEEDGLVLVPHSNAGLYVAAVDPSDPWNKPVCAGSLPKAR